MIAQRSVLRLAQRSTPVRSAIQRRFNSTDKLPSWAVDNEFNRERAAVKHHAASTSSTFKPSEALLAYLHLIFADPECY